MRLPKTPVSIVVVVQNLSFFWGKNINIDISETKRARALPFLGVTALVPLCVHTERERNKMINKGIIGVRNFSHIVSLRLNYEKTVCPIPKIFSVKCRTRITVPGSIFSGIE